MSRSDWFRKTTWSAADEEAFNSRLRRSRTAFHRAQYLRIQALHLADTGDASLVRAALALLHRMASECPEPSQMPFAHIQVAQCHKALGDLDAAVDAFRLGLAYRGTVDSGVTLEFPWFIVQHKWTALYDEALDVLERANPVFPIQTFKAAATRALIAEWRGDAGTAARHARHALEAASLPTSPSQHHRDLGVVGGQHPEIRQHLRTLITAERHA